MIAFLVGVVCGWCAGQLMKLARFLDVEHDESARLREQMKFARARQAALEGENAKLHARVVELEDALGRGSDDQRLAE
jgi:hypothetical protein